MKQKDNLESLFENLQGQFDIEEPQAGHKERFLDKLNENSLSGSEKRLSSRKWWKPLSIAASIAILIAVGLGTFNVPGVVADSQVTEVPEEVQEAQFYFASLIEEQVAELNSLSGPETKVLVDDALLQLSKLEENYQALNKEFQEKGYSKALLNAMITNFQTRINLLQDVMDRIEEVKQLKNETYENNTI